MVKIRYLVKKPWKDFLEKNGISAEEQRLIDGRYELRVYCWRYDEQETRNKIKSLIPDAKEVEVKK